MGLESIYATPPQTKANLIADFLKSGLQVKRPTPAAGSPTFGSQLTKPPTQAPLPQTPFAQTKDAGVPAQSYVADPVLAKIRAANAADIGQAETDALEAKRKALLDFGDPAVAAKLLGGSDPTIGAISSDPRTAMSTLARINRSSREAVRTNENDLNASNLFYGGERGRVLGQLDAQRQEHVTDAERQLELALAQIADALAGAKKTARDAELNAPPSTAPPVGAGAGAGAAGADGAAGGSGAQQTTLPTFAPPAAPQLPPFDTGQTSLPPFDTGQTALPAFNPGTPQLPPFTVPQQPAPTPNTTGAPGSYGGVLAAEEDGSTCPPGYHFDGSACVLI